jgi:hypothetical protein
MHDKIGQFVESELVKNVSQPYEFITYVLLGLMLYYNYGRSVISLGVKLL